MFPRKNSNKSHKNSRLGEQHCMYWPPDDQHRHHQQNYYNKFQNVQHQNGIQQAAATVPPQHQQYNTPPPPLQQQQQSSLSTAQQNQSHYPTNQQHPQHQHNQWPTRPPILNAPPFIHQFSNTATTQYCTAPPQCFLPQRATQASGVSAPSQPRPCLPPGCAIYPIPQQATALRHNVISQPQAAITKPMKSSARQVQVQYFPSSQYCQSPLGQPTYGHVAATTVPETFVVKKRKHAIPIIDPRTKENILERELRRSETISPPDVVSTTAMSSTAVCKDSDLKKESHLPQSEPNIEKELTEPEKHLEESNEQVKKDITDSSAQSPAVVDHVELIKAKKEMEEITRYNNSHSDDVNQKEFNSITMAITNDIEDDSKASYDKETFTGKGNPPSKIEAREKPSKSSTAAPAKVIKSQQKQPLSTTKPPSKKFKRNQRLKESRKKQRADLVNNNNSNQIENNDKQTMTEPCNSKRLTVKFKENSKKRDGETATQVRNGDCVCIPTPLEGHERNDEGSKKIDDSTLNATADNDHSSQLYDGPKLTKSEQIASEILGIDSTDEKELLFLNSSVSGYEEEISSSPAQDTAENGEANDILFGDFSQENLTQEISTQESNESEKEKGDDEEESQSSSPNEEKKFAYTLRELKSLANGLASKIPPTFRGKICELIGKNHRGKAAATAAHMQPAYQQNQMYQQISYKASLNYLNRKCNKRVNDTPPYQQSQPQQYEQQQNQRDPDIIVINLSLNEEIQLAKSENAWVPAGLQNCTAKADSEDDEQILKKIRGILNKLTPENFDKLLESAANFPMPGVERIKKVMLLIFEKTISEPNFAPTYARFCKFLFNPQNENHAMFKTILIKRIQEEFESNVDNAKAKNAKLMPLIDRLATATDPKEKQELKAELDDQEYQFRRRAWGTVRFIGEMFKLGFLATTRMCICVENLLDPRCEEKLEYMCKLLTTVGAQLESVENMQMGGDRSKISERLDTTFVTIKHLVDRKKAAGQKISSRVRFMMQDVLELRGRLWDQKSVPTLPSREVSPALRSEPSSSQRELRISSNYIPLDGYEKRKQPEDGQKNSSHLNIDVSKLPVFSIVEKTRQLGNSSPLMWKTVGRAQQAQQPTPLTMQQNSRHLSRSPQPEMEWSTPSRQPELSSRECGRLLNGLIELAIEEESQKEWFAKWKEIPVAHHPTIIYHLLTEYLHSAKVKRPQIDACARLFSNLMKENLLTRLSFDEGYQKFSDVWDDILVDVPKGWQYVLNILGPLLHFELIPFDMIWDKNWFNTTGGDKFLNSMIIHFTSEFGANYMRYFWECNSLRWDKFMAEERILPFITNNHFEFIDNDKCVPPIFIQRSPDELVQHIKALLMQSDQNIDLIIDFISTNVHIDCSFVRNLTMFLCDYTVTYCYIPDSSNSSKKSRLSDSPPSTITTSSSYKLRKDIFVTKCLPLLRLCTDSKDEHELSCLGAIVATCKQLYDSSADELICAILTELYGEVISKESFEKWHQQQQLNAEGGDMLTNVLNAFFKNLLI